MKRCNCWDGRLQAVIGGYGLMVPRLPNSGALCCTSGPAVVPAWPCRAVAWPCVAAACAAVGVALPCVAAAAISDARPCAVLPCAAVAGAALPCVAVGAGAAAFILRAASLDTALVALACGSKAAFVGEASMVGIDGCSKC